MAIGVHIARAKVMKEAEALKEAADTARERAEIDARIKERAEKAEIRKALLAQKKADIAARRAEKERQDAELAAQVQSVTAEDVVDAEVLPPSSTALVGVSTDALSEAPLTDLERAFVEEAPRRKGERLSHVEIAHVLYLSTVKNLSQGQIAKRMNCTQATISRILKAWAPTEALAKATLRKGADTLAERVVKDANVEEAIDVLTRLDVLAPAKSDKAAGGGVQVLVGLNIGDLLNPR